MNSNIYKKFNLHLTIVVIGILFTITSALLSHYIIQKNMMQITETGNRIITIDEQIKQRWQEVLLLERNEDTAIILNQLSNEQPNEVTKKYLHKVMKRIGKGEKDISLSSLMEEIQKHRLNTVEVINDLYLQLTELKQESKKINNKNASISSIALFLQIMGMIMVLSAESWRRR